MATGPGPGSSALFDVIGSQEEPHGGSTLFDVIGSQVKKDTDSVRTKQLNIDVPLPGFVSTVSGAPVPGIYVGHIIYVTDETGGPVLAFSDGTNWRRVTDRAVIS
jgi:hypothetical protein